MSDAQSASNALAYGKTAFSAVLVTRTDVDLFATGNELERRFGFALL